VLRHELELEEEKEKKNFPENFKNQNKGRVVDEI
jgi:hypothetical protein